MKNILMTIMLLSLPASAYAGLSDAGMHPMMAPNMNPNQGQGVQYAQHAQTSQHQDVKAQQHISPQQRVAPQQHVQASRPQQTNKDRGQAVRHEQDVDRHDDREPGYFRRDADYYGFAQVIYPIADVSTDFVVPDGFSTVIVNGETFYYNQGAFYQQVGNTLEAIPAVTGAIVDYIPQDYQIVMVNGVHYLVTGGVYYQRVEQGFMVVEPPTSDQG